MKNKFEKLNETFDVEQTQEETNITISPEVIPTEVKSTSIDDVTKDYEYTRGNLYSLIEKGQEAINGILDLAQQTDAPRAYEVAGQLIKSVGDVTDKLIDLQKKVNEIENPKKASSSQNVTNALFVGSTSDLLKLIKQNKTVEDK